ncbi:metallophosphoesterase [Isosphaeraceae bacterium EP7]
MRFIHLSDVHVWRYAWKPWKLFSKRAVGMIELVSGRAGRFRLERLEEVVARIEALNADHVLITGDLTTTALRHEFHVARAALEPLLVDPERATVIPGNHDRYTWGSVRSKEFETHFGEFAPRSTFPWLRRLDERTAILGLDPTRSHLSATGRLPEKQFAEARALLADEANRPERLIVACHYPLEAPTFWAGELAKKRMKNAPEVEAWLAGLGPHLYCCGHVHAAWAFRPRAVPEQLCLNAGAPLMHDKIGTRPPGFLEVELHEGIVSVLHHAWVENDRWEVRPMHQDPAFFDVGERAAGTA